MTSTFLRWQHAAPALLLGLVFGVRAEAAPRSVRLAATLYGETVGAVRLTVDEGPTRTTFTYRSDLRVVREKLRLRQHAFIESTVENATGALVRAVSRRCAGAEGAEATCGENVTLRDRAELPALAVEWWFARGGSSAGESRCVKVIDEESASVGEACARVSTNGRATVLQGERFGQPFEATWRDGALRRVEFSSAGAAFAEFEGELSLSDADLYADPVPSSGDPEWGLKNRSLELVVTTDAAVVAGLQRVNGEAPWQSTELFSSESASIRVTQPKPVLNRKTRAVLDKAAFLVAQARGQHVDCQAATSWFVREARRRKWKVQPVTGIAWVDGRFAYHAWVVLEAPGGQRLPVDPLLAQLPADAGHVQLLPAGEDAGALLVKSRGRLNVAVTPSDP